MSEGRRAFAANDYAGAVEEFKAARTARPLDAQARGELGYALLHAGQLEQADDELRLGAELARGDTKLAAQIWFNRGLVAEKQKRMDLARAAFAVSDRLAPSAATRARLDGKSKCPVAVEREATPLKTRFLSIVTGWKGVHAALMERIMGGDDGDRERNAPAPTSEQEAKDRACRIYKLNERDKDNEARSPPCAGKSPWRINTGYMLYRYFYTAVYELGGGRFALVDSVHGGGGPMVTAYGGLDRLEGDRLLVVTTKDEAHFVTEDSECIASPMDAAILEAGSIGYGDVKSLTTTSFVVYDTTDGRPLVSGVAWGDNSESLVDLAAGTPPALVIKEQGCPSSTPLAR